MWIFWRDLPVLQKIYFHAERAVDHLQQGMYSYSSKHISNLFTVLIQKEIQIKQLGLGCKCASQLCCSQEWAKSRHGQKHPNNLTFEFEVCCFNFRCFDLNFDVLQNKMTCWLKNTLSQTRRLIKRLINPLNKLHKWILSVFSGTVPLVVAMPFSVSQVRMVTRIFSPIRMCYRIEKRFSKYDFRLRPEMQIYTSKSVSCQDLLNQNRANRVELWLMGKTLSTWMKNVKKNFKRKRREQ